MNELYDRVCLVFENVHVRKLYQYELNTLHYLFLYSFIFISDAASYRRSLMICIPIMVWVSAHLVVGISGVCLVVDGEEQLEANPEQHSYLVSMASITIKYAQ